MVLALLLNPYSLIAIPLLPIAFYLVPYLADPHRIRSIPGPFLASISNLWLLYQCRHGRRYAAVHEVHRRHGKFARLQPDHVSVADADAIPIIYGHGNGFLKAQFYDAFVSIQRGLFNTRDRAEHTRKRKMVSHTFSARSIGQFEQYIHNNLRDLMAQWDRISGEARDRSQEWAEIDSLHWFNYLAFDIIGDLAFGAPFGMLKSGADVAEMRATPDSKPTYVSAIQASGMLREQVINRRGEVSATLGCLPQLKPYATWLPDPFFTKGVQAVKDLAGIAIARVKDRIDMEASGIKSERLDLLARLMEGKDDKGNRLGQAELTAEALTQLIAGSDTTSNTSCAFLYWTTRTEGVWEKLQKEIDPAVELGEVARYDNVKDLVYMNQAINEVLRIHSTSSLGLPRLVPESAGPVEVCGKTFYPGTVLSVPAYTIHHSKEVWGPDADDYVPDRWEEGRLTEKQKAAFVPFSHGPRACVGRNVAEMELALIVSTVVRNYEFDLRQGELHTREGFLRKPLQCMVGMRKRTS